MSHRYYQLTTGNVIHLDADCAFPPIHYALTEPNGLIAIGGALTTERLLEAYQQGIFPWFSDDEPVMWWSPNPRMVLFPNELKVSRSLKKVMNRNKFDIRFNTAFKSVITACSQTARANQPGTWITNSIINAYSELHHAGYAISAEAWLDDVLVGGCYGVKIGHMFYGESMFHTETDASKVAFVALVEQLKNEGVQMIDCQMKTAHLASFGAYEIPRAQFLQRLNTLITGSKL